MTDNEQLERIKARCRANIALAEALKKKWACQSDYVKDMCQSIAGWRSTIAAIEGLRQIAASETSADPYEACNHPSDASDILTVILANWPEELL